MARKEIRMEELVEVLYQWHKGRNISQIKHSLGLDRKTIKKYIELVEPYGFLRDGEVMDDVYYLQFRKSPPTQEVGGSPKVELKKPITAWNSAEASNE